MCVFLLRFSIFPTNAQLKPGFLFSLFVHIRSFSSLTFMRRFMYNVHECVFANECVICIEFTGIPLNRCRIFSLVCPFVYCVCVAVWRCVPSHLYVLHRSNINIAWIHTNVIYLITTFFFVIGCCYRTVFMCRLLVAHWRRLWLLGLALSPRCYIRFVSMYVCVCHVSPHLLRSFSCSRTFTYIICEHDGPLFLVPCCSVQFSSVGFCNMFLRCHLFALLTYFVCLRNCFPAAKQQCTISLQ